jgi:predicted HAD superfamily Cof-like phosphohydrolase
LDHVLKELADLVDVCYQYAANEGWNLDEALDRVHKSNMSKLDENGQPILRADGKVLKGPRYEPPHLGDLI